MPLWSPTMEWDSENKSHIGEKEGFLRHQSSRLPSICNALPPTESLLSAAQMPPGFTVPGPRGLPATLGSEAIHIERLGNV